MGVWSSNGRYPMSPRQRAAARAAGLLSGLALDAAFGDPRRWHPVAGYGELASAVERRMYAPSRSAGVRFAALAVGAPVGLATLAALGTRRRPVLRAVLTAGVTWAVLGGSSLRREGAAMAAALDAGDLAAARTRLPHLCGRDPSALDRTELARATVESVAENTSDAAVAPLFWGAVAGLPGLVGYRAINTLDAMVGHHSTRYARFGTAAARLDDVANLVPARATGVLTAWFAPLVGGDRRRALAVWRRDRRSHPSPNSGQCEAAVAGALGIRLGGRNVYAGRVEHRPVLGDGRSPGAGDVVRAGRLSGAVVLASAAIAAAGVLAAGQLSTRDDSGRRGLGGARGRASRPGLRSRARRGGRAA